MKRLALVIVALTLAALGWQLWTTQPATVVTEVEPLRPGGGALESELTQAPAGEPLQPKTSTAPERASLRGDSMDPEVSRVLLRRSSSSGEEPSSDAWTGVTVIEGRVTDEEGAPVSGVIVRASERVAGGQSAVGQARTDGLGAYAIHARIGSARRRTVRLDASRMRQLAELGYGPLDPDLRSALLAQLRVMDSSSDRTGEVTVSVEDARGLRAEERFVPKLGERQRRVDLRIRRDFRFRGDVADGNESVPLASVLLFDADRNLLGTTTTDEEGAFELTAPPAGRYELLARSIGHGAAGLGGVSLGPEQRSFEQKIALGGVGVLRGRVQYPDGKPVAGLELHGVLDSLAAQNPERPHFPTPVQLLAEERDGGLALSTAVTGSDGRFQMLAVQPGSYRLVFEQDGTGLDPEGVFTTGTEHGIRFDACRIFVRVIGGTSRRSRTDEPQSAQDGVRVHCVRADWREVPKGTPLHHQVAVSRSGGVGFLVQDEVDWVVFAEHDGELTPEAKVFFRTKPGDGAAQVDLTPGKWISGESVLTALAPPEERGRLELVVRDLQGERLDAYLWLWRLEEERLLPVYSRRRIGEDKPLTPMRAGSLRYKVRLAEKQSDWWLSPGVRDVDLAPGAALELELVAAPTLSLSLTLVQEDGAPRRDPRTAFFRAEFLPAGPGAERSSSAARRPDPMDIDTQLQSHAFDLRHVILGEERFATLRRPAGAYRLRLVNVDDETERYECGLRLEAGDENRFEVVLPGP